MHELSVVQTLIETVQQHAKQEQAGKVSRIAIEVGALTCIDQDRIQFCFDMVKSDADMHGSELQINTVTATAKCQDCHNTFELKNLGLPCPTCGSYSYDMITGNELNLTEIELC